MASEKDKSSTTGKAEGSATPPVAHTPRRAVEDPMTRQLLHNDMHNQNAFTPILPVNNLRTNFSLAKTRMAPFVLNNITREMFTMAAIYGVGRYCLEGDANAANLERGMVVGIGEVLAPGLPDDLWLPEPQARAKCIQVVRAIMQNPQLFELFGVNIENFLQVIQADAEIPQALHIVAGNPAWARADMDIYEAMRILLRLGEESTRTNPSIPLKMLVAMMVSTLKKGSVTHSFLEKVFTGLRQEVGLDVMISQDMIREISRAYGLYVNADVARTVVEHWKAWLPENALTLRLIIARAEWEGLTGFNTIIKAVQSFPTFPWNVLATIPVYAAEIQAFGRAQVTVANNPYYGFNRDLGDAEIRNYRNLASACAALVQKANGDENIMKAQCFKARFAYRERVMRLINDFVNNVGPARQNDPIVDAFIRGCGGQVVENNDSLKHQQNFH